MIFRSETAYAQHGVLTKSATHDITVLDVQGVFCNSTLTTHQEGAAVLQHECSVAQISVEYTHTLCSKWATMRNPGTQTIGSWAKQD